MSTHPLQALLQLQLASDAYAVLHLPYVLSTLSPEYFLPSSHLPKWTARINSLLYSKDPGSRWAGLCLAYKTSLHSRSIMIECAQSWLAVALPTLSKPEPLPTLKAAIRLLRCIFTAVTDVPEFQRQVATPNVPKFTAALVNLADSRPEQEFKILVLKTLTRLIPHYPTLHRASHTALSALSLRFLNGTAPASTSAPLLKAASQLYTVLHLTGGKVGAANLWKKSVDETLAFGWTAFLSIRSTSPQQGNNLPPPAAANDPLTNVPLNVDRLRCSVIILCDLLSATTYRSVQMPLGALTSFVGALLSCTSDETSETHSEPAVRAMELSVIPAIWVLGCDLLTCLAKCARHHLTPNLTRLLSYLTFHLEQKLTSSQRLTFLQCLLIVLKEAHSLHTPFVPTRLIKAILPSLSIVLAAQSEVEGTAMGSSKSNRKGKKRARGYEGDELFKVSREVICATRDDGNVILAALDVVHILLPQNPNLTPAVQSISARVALAMLLVLPQMSPASLSSDLSFHGHLLHKVQLLCTELGSGTTSAMSKSLGLVIGSIVADGNDHGHDSRDFDLLLHPRVPPLVRSLPHVESLSLFRAEESQEEKEIRQSLGFHVPGESQKPDDTADEEQSETRRISLSPQPAKEIIVTSSNYTARIVQPATTIIVAPTSRPIAALSSASTPISSNKPSIVAKAVVPEIQRPIVPMQIDDDEDFEMPTIDMDSDSE